MNTKTQIMDTQGLVDILNDLVKRDNEAITNLINYRVPCNSKLAEHPNVQVGASANSNDKEAPVKYIVGLAGILNGIFRELPNGKDKFVCFDVDETGIITHFYIRSDKDFY